MATTQVNPNTTAHQLVPLQLSGNTEVVPVVYTFDRVPLFDHGIGGIEFSIFYEDRARRLWGTPTGFLYKMVWVRAWSHGQGHRPGRADRPYRSAASRKPPGSYDSSKLRSPLAACRV